MDPRKDFIAQLERYRKGSISRRHFFGVTGLGTAVAALAAGMPELVAPRRAYAGNLGDRVALTSWPNYHDPKNFDKFTAETGVKVELTVFGSDSESFLQRFNANLAVISCSGLTPEGPNDVNPAAAGIKRAMLARAESNMLLLDHSKFDVLALENVCSLESVRLIVADRAPQGDLARAIRRAGIGIEVAAEAAAKALRRSQMR